MRAAEELNISDDNAKSMGGLVARHSEFIGVWLTNNLDKLTDICSRFGGLRDKQTIFDDLMSEDIYKMSETEFIAYLRFFKMREYTHIAANDIYFNQSVEKVTAHVSAFAAAACQAAYLYAKNDLKWEHGIPRDEAGNEIGFCIIGLGKLGGWELNFSSDIDVIYVYGTDKGNTDGQKPIDTHVYFSKISEKNYKIHR